MLLFSENRMILASVVLSQYTRFTDEDRQATYYDNSRTLQCNYNVRLKTETKFLKTIENITNANNEVRVCNRNIASDAVERRCEACGWLWHHPVIDDVSTSSWVPYRRRWWTVVGGLRRTTIAGHGWRMSVVTRWCGPTPAIRRLCWILLLLAVGIRWLCKTFI